MKQLLLLITLVFTSNLYGQSLNGKYSSNYTTYESIIKPENNFEEETLFKILVVMEHENNPGMLAILNPLEPTNLLLYVLGSVNDVLFREEGTIIVFDAFTDHLDKNEEVEVMLNIDTSENLEGIMIYNSNYRQTYYNIKIRE